MKKLLLSLIAFSFVTLVFGQDDPAKSLKSAKKALSSYMLDTNGNKGKLDEAKTQIDAALQSDVNKTYEGWMAYGNIYSEFGGKDEGAQMLNKEAKLMYPDAPLEAVKGFQSAHALATKKFQKSEALDGIKINFNRLINAGIAAYNDKNFAKAYNSYSTVVKANGIMKEAGEKGTLDDANVSNFVYYAAVCAQSANMNAEAEANYKSLIGKGFAEESACYSGLYNVLNTLGKKEEAEKLLEEGVAKHPNATDLLFNQINNYLRAGKLDVLIDKLKLAISKEPTNVGLYSTLGNVYDNLAQIEQKNGNAAKSKEYFDLSSKTYADVLAKDPKNFDANYSVGALYYNKAAAYTETLNKLNDDYSDAGVKKYDAMKAEMEGIFGQALPYFQKAESANPNDRNTLVALKEILTRLNKLDEASAIKERMENVDAKKNNATPYYKN